MKRVIMYTSNYCPYCVRAEQLLKNKGINPEKINIEHDESLEREMIQKSGRRSVPQIFIGSYHVGGFDDLYKLEKDGQLDALLSEEE